MALKREAIEKIVGLVRKHLYLLEADLESAGLLEIGRFVEVTAQVESRRKGLYGSSTIHVDLIKDGGFPPLELNTKDWALIKKAVSIMQEPPCDVQNCLSVLKSIEKKESITKDQEGLIVRINRYFRRLRMSFLIEMTETPGKCTIKKFQLG